MSLDKFDINDRIKLDRMSNELDSLKEDVKYHENFIIAYSFIFLFVIMIALVSLTESRNVVEERNKPTQCSQDIPKD
jgi:hypothetical protein